MEHQDTKYNLIPANRNPPSYIHDAISEKECSQRRGTCVELIGEKTKTAVSALKIWLLVATLAFLVSICGSVIYTAYNYGTIEEKVENVSKDISTIKSEIGALRQEIYDWNHERRLRVVVPTVAVTKQGE